MFDRFTVGHRVLQLLVLALLLLVLADLAFRHLPLQSSPLQVRWMAIGPGLLVAVVLTFAALAATFLLPGSRDQQTIGLTAADGMFAAVVMLGFVWVLTELWIELEPASRVARHMAYQIYQAILAGITFLLLTAAGRKSWPDWALWLLQWWGGAVLLATHFLQATPQAWVWLLWQAGNVLLSSTLFMLAALALVKASSVRAWLPLLAGLVGLGIVMEDMVATPAEALAPTLIHQVFAGLLTLVWMIASGRMELSGRLARLRRPVSDASAIAQQFAHSGLYGYGHTPSEHDSGQAVNQERQRIAQELHDGVGSQMVAILAGLDKDDPRESDLASSLEQCLLEVKILVDAIDDADEHVIDALGRLRYRVQPSLDRLGIVLHWNVPLDGPLTTVRRERSRQVLRVAQEALANAMRHSGAATIRLSCGLDSTARALVLEIRDDGHGMSILTTQSSSGKGITGMRRRAAAIGGVLEFESAPGGGTRVRLTVPLGVASTM